MNDNPQGHNVDTSSPAAEIAGAGVVPANAVPQETATVTGQAPVSGGEPPVGTPTEQAGTSEQPPVESDGLGYDEPIDNPAVQGVANIFKDAGIKADDALKFFQKAIDSNNVADIDEGGIIKALGDQLGNMVLSAMKGVFYEGKQRADATKSKFLEAVGGEDSWSIIRQWITDKEERDPEFKTTVDGYRELLEKDEASALLVANALKSMYRDANVTRKPSAFVQGDPRAAAIGVSPILDIREFGRMYSKARRDGNQGEADQILARWRVGGGKNRK